MDINKNKKNKIVLTLVLIVGFSISTVTVLNIFSAKVQLKTNIKNNEIERVAFNDSFVEADVSSYEISDYDASGFNREKHITVSPKIKTSGYQTSGFNREGYTISSQQIKEVATEVMSVDSVNNKENRVKLTAEDPVSTFSIDTDDGSYKLFKQYINNGNQIDKSAVRIEEFINAFSYDYDKPKSLEKPFSSEVEIFNSPWNDKKIIKIGVQGYEVKIDKMPPVNLTFLIDTSGSMQGEMSKIKTSLKMLVKKLRPEDSLSLVTYAGNTHVVLSSENIKNKRTILKAIEKLNAGGSTNGEGGIYLAYEENKKSFNKEGINRIILVSDGDFNVGISRTDDLKELIKEKRKSGTTFSTVGISEGHYSDSNMEQMANVGNGNYTFIGNMNDARETFSERFVSTLMNVAKDVKVQVEFNPNVVKEYRLIGYENRMLKKEDFNNDKIDAGEIPSGMMATALYEIVLVGEEGLHLDSRYNKDSVDNNEFINEYAFLNLRYKKRGEDKSHLIQYPITKNDFSDNLSDDSKLAVSAAGFAQVYKDSEFITNSYSYDDVINNVESIDNKNEKIIEFLNIIKNTKAQQSIND